MNPYQKFVSSLARLVTEGRSLPLGDLPSRKTPRPAPNAPIAMIFSPHPDDECIIGGLALRLMREAGVRVINVAVTLGSDPKRREERQQELQNACDWIGFELELAAPGGLEQIRAIAGYLNPGLWDRSIQAIRALLVKHQPRVIFLPHQQDWHSTHIGTHFLVADALATMPAEFQCHFVETEFWGQMARPNLMVESSVEDVAELVGALSFHAGEVRRNPYHLRLPAWLQDNVRRGAELIGGQGGVAPDFTFATLYRIQQWKNGIREFFKGGRQVSVRDDPGEIFGLGK